MKKYYIYKIINGNGSEHYQILIKSYFLWIFYKHHWHYNSLYEDIWMSTNIIDAENKIKNLKDEEKFFTRYELVGEYEY